MRNRTVMKGRVLAAVGSLLIALPALAQHWVPYNELGDFYPAYAIAVSTLAPNRESGKDEPILGDQNGIMGILITPERPNTGIKLEIRCTTDLKLFEPAFIDVVAPVVGEEYLIKPVIPFNYDRLASMRQSATTYITYILTINGQKQTPHTQRLRVRSINDCPFAFIDQDDKETSIDFVFAAYVNEDHPIIQEILQDALRKNYTDSFVGYQGGKVAVYRQIMAIWRVLQDRGIRYSSIPVVAPVSEGVMSQHIRLLDESMKYTQANCADGTVLLASVLRKIAINPTLVVIPGHMFVGFDLDTEGRQQAYLETTLIGTDARDIGIANNRLYKTLLGAATELKTQVAVKSFVSAVEVGNATFEQNKAKIRREKAGYALIDIATARRAGVAPIMYVGHKRE